MKLMKQMAIILLMTFLGELFNKIIPLPIPTPMWGMILLFIALSTGIVKLDMVDTVADYLNSIMIMIFVPFGVGIMANYSQLADYIVQIIIIIFASYFLVFFVSGKTTDFVISLKEKKDSRNSSSSKEAVHE